MKSHEGPAGHASDSSAVLCTPDKTYNLRQVSTSNTVFITQPSVISSDSLELPSLQAVAQCHSTLEVQARNDVSAATYIKAALPTYASTGHYEPKSALSKEQLFADIPLSDGECEQSWLDLACFESGQPRRAFVPSASAKLKVWQDMLALAISSSIDLSKPLTEECQAAVLGSPPERDLPHDLYRALLRSISTDANEFDEVGADELKCARIVGLSFLEHHTKGIQPPMLVDTFRDAWADLLPEQWRSRTELRLLDGSYQLDDSGKKISHVESEAVPDTTANSTTPAETRSTSGAKRKWHEKFRASKKPT